MKTRRSKRANAQDGDIPSNTDSQRLDIWLWASRFHKTRKLANEAIKGGHVAVNGSRAKAARQIRVGDRLRIRRFPVEYHVDVLGLSLKRLGAPLASALYQETKESTAAREDKLQLLRDQRAGLRYDRARPGKREREKMVRIKNQTPDWLE